MLFKDFVQINPKVDLKKGKRYPYVGMADVNPSRGYVTNSETREYKNSRSRFKEGDTLFARITPCLENGKITRFKSDEIKKGFGSTEFFVFRAKEGISDPNYVYYLSRSPLIRKTAEKSMAGASGRQRADISAIEEIEINPPELHRQQKIASILSAFDNLIENNTRRIAILEEMAQRIYREWFVHFRFPSAQGRRRSTAIATERYGEQATPADSKPKMVDSGTQLGEIPEGWEVKRLEDFCKLTLGQSPKSEFYNEKGKGLPFHQGVRDFGDRYPTTTTWCVKDKRIAEEGDILFSVRAPVGRINIANTKMIIGRGLHSIRSKYGNQAFIFHQLIDKFQEEDTMGSGTIYKSVTKKDMLNLKLIDPGKEMIEKFEEKAVPIFNKIKVLTDKNAKLKETRDLLLPKLILGEIEL